MVSDFIDFTAPSMQGGYPRTPESLPHGLLRPPDEVREMLTREKVKWTPPGIDAACEERILNEWTIAYYFDYLGHDVIYRQTADGPEVLAVGWDEVIRLRKTWPLEEQRKLKQWMG